MPNFNIVKQCELSDSFRVKSTIDMFTISGDKVKEEFNWKTVPVIAVQRSDGLREFIGGCDDLEKYLEEIND